jgi:hypothetical protein
MDTILGLFGILVWIATVMALAAGVTYAVIRLSPGGKSDKKPEQAPTESAKPS